MSRRAYRKAAHRLEAQHGLAPGTVQQPLAKYLDRAEDALISAERELRLEVGDIFEDGFYHPVYCLGVDYRNDEIWGVSLIDGSWPRCMSLLHDGVRKLTPKQAWDIKRRGPSSVRARESIAMENRWWLRSDPTERLQVKTVRSKAHGQESGRGARAPAKSARAAAKPAR